MSNDTSDDEPEHTSMIAIGTPTRTAPQEAPPLRPYLIDQGGDVYVVCAPSEAQARAVARQRRLLRGAGGPMAIAAVPMRPLSREELAQVIADRRRAA